MQIVKCPIMKHHYSRNFKSAKKLQIFKYFFYLTDLLFSECSAYNGENVGETFLRCARSILQSIENGEINPDRHGSGMQYGNLSLNQLQRNNENSVRSYCESSTCIIK